QKSGTQISSNSVAKQGLDLDNLDDSTMIDNKSSLGTAAPTHSHSLEHPALNAIGPGDFRQPLINSGALEMRYELLTISAKNSSASHQDGRCEVDSISFVDHEGHVINSLQGGSTVTLLVSCLANRELKSPIVGFAIIDRRGLTIFGENTYGSGRYAEMSIAAGESFQARFTMEWPWLASGDYSLTIAVASGNQLSHVNHCWLNECMIISATPETKLANGVFSPSFLNIDLLKLGD
ncbi:MAG: Wzt carbohydrate-binding domain-containing protein, partial [Prochlorococcaceae cyanobacterium]